MGDPVQVIDLIRKARVGAGEGARTLDPELGKLVL